MDKRSFNFMFTLAVVSMIVIGTYKISRKKNNPVKTVTATEKSK